MHRLVTFDEDYEKYKQYILREEHDLKQFVDVQFAVDKPKI